MTALLAAKKLVRYGGEGPAPNFIGPFKVAANAIIYHGSLVGLAGGYAKQCEGTDDICVGVANLERWYDLSDQGVSFQAAGLPGTSGNVIDNTGGADGARQVLVEVGVFKFVGKTSDAPAQTDIAAPTYVEDDATVKMTAGGAIAAGTVWRIDDDGNPFVRVGV